MEDFRRDTEYWNHFYKSRLDITDASLFAEDIGKILKPSRSILDLGCGNGRDSIYFLKLGLNVTAIDASDVAISRLKNEHCEENIEFVCGDFVSSSEIYKRQYDYIYSRFTIHAIDAEQEDVVLRNVYNALNEDGQFFIEVRSIHDDMFGLGKSVGGNAYIYEGHYRRFIEMERLICKMKEIGFSIESSREERGFAPYRDSDPLVIRIIAKKLRRKFVLFGAGSQGKKALKEVGNENVLCFCDNNRELWGTDIWGKRVISPAELKTLPDIHIILLTAKAKICDELRNQMQEELLIDHFLYYVDLPMYLRMYSCTVEDFLFHHCGEIYKLMYYSMENRYKEQKWISDYFMAHTDITSIKPATGFLRRKQLRLLRFMEEFLQDFKELDLHPFLVAGTLIGNVRHGGYIPWDDDLDFGLMREEYVRLIDAFKEKCYVEIIRYKCKDPLEKFLQRIDEILKEHPNQYVMIIMHDHIHIHKGISCLDELSLDFFSFDYYAEEYSLEEHFDYLKKIQEKMNDMELIPDILDFLYDEIEHNPNILRQKTSHIFPGIDDFMSFVHFSHAKSWVNADVLFPLKKCNFENIQLWTARDEEEFLELHCPDWKQYPEDVCLPSHEGLRDEYLMKYYPSAEFYLTQLTDLFLFLPLYYLFEMNGIYVRFAMGKYRWHWGDYDKLIALLEKYQVRYIEKSYGSFDYAFFSQQSYMLEKYNKNCVQVLCISNRQKREDDMVNAFDLSLFYNMTLDELMAICAEIERSDKNNETLYTILMRIKCPHLEQVLAAMKLKKKV